MRRLIAVCLLGLLSMAMAGVALAQEKTFAVLPFTINGPEKYAYLGPGIQDMLASRLTWPGRYKPVDKGQIAKNVATTPKDKSAAAAVLPKLGADFLIYGSATIAGDDASLDITTLGADGKSWPKSETVKLGALIPRLEGIAKDISAQAFQRAENAPKAERAQAPGGKPQFANPELVYNERDTKNKDEFYLNPQFRYEQNPEMPGQWQTQSLNFPSLGMVVGDADGDGQNEVFILEENRLHAYRMRDRRLEPLDEFKMPPRVQFLKLNIIDYSHDGKKKVICTGWDGSQPYSVVVGLVDGKLQAISNRVRLFLNVVHMPPDYVPTLVGMAPGSPNPLKGPVHEVLSVADTGQLGKRIPLPEFANVFNFGFLPQPDGSYKYLMVDSSDHIKVYANTSDLLHTTAESYASSPIGVQMYARMAGMGLRSVKDENEEIVEYIPNRMIPVRLGADKRYELIVNRNISMAAEFLSRYRNFPYGEIHSVFWDGVGLSLIWKTRRLKGSIADYGVADIDNDGKPDLYVAINTYKGLSGFESSRTVVQVYQLDPTKSDLNTPTSKE